MTTDPTQNTALTVHQPQPLTLPTWRMIAEAAPVIHQSRLFGVASKEQAQAIMLKGAELGFPLTASFEFVKVIEGRPELTPRGALAILHSSPHIKRIEIKRLTQGTQYLGHECTIERANGFAYTAKWTLEDARRADLLKPKSGWEKYPENMCMWRAVGFAADVAAPDVTMGGTALMKQPEQFGVALTADGDVIEGQVTTTTRTINLIEKTLEDLIAQYGPEAVISANGGAIPEGEQVGAVAELLGKGNSV